MPLSHGGGERRWRATMTPGASPRIKRIDPLIQYKSLKFKKILEKSNEISDIYIDIINGCSKQGEEQWPSGGTYPRFWVQ